jgi:hypothetical protein
MTMGVAHFEQRKQVGGVGAELVTASVWGRGLSNRKRGQWGRSVARLRLARNPKERILTKPHGSRCNSHDEVVCRNRFGPAQ